MEHLGAYMGAFFGGFLGGFLGAICGGALMGVVNAHREWRYWLKRAGEQTRYNLDVEALMAERERENVRRGREWEAKQ